MSIRKHRGTTASPGFPEKSWTRPTGPIGTAQAKAHLLSIMEEVRQNGTPVIVTRRGKPHVQIAPLDAAAPVADIFGCMKGTITITGDIVGPEPDEWDALQ